MKARAIRLLIMGLAFFVANGCGSSVAIWTAGEVPFVRSTPEVIDRMFDLARVKPGDVVYDIGSGDGAIIIRAAKKYGVRGVGIEIDQELVLKARDIAFREKVEHLVEFRVQDAFTVDVSPATVVTLRVQRQAQTDVGASIKNRHKGGFARLSNPRMVAGPN